MRTNFRRGGRLTAVLGMTAIAVLAFAGPASASHAEAGQNSATGLFSNGAIYTELGLARFPAGPPTDTVLNADITGSVNVTAETLTLNADATSASATVETLALTLFPATPAEGATTLNATAVSSECSTNGTTVTGSATLTDAIIDLPILSDIALDVSPAANTNVSIPGVATIILNQQTVDPVSGALTVTGIFIELLPGTGGAQIIEVASSTCQVTVLVIPVIAPPFAVGAGVLGLIGYGVFLFRRRQTTTPGAA